MCVWISRLLPLLSLLRWMSDATIRESQPATCCGQLYQSLPLQTCRNYIKSWHITRTFQQQVSVSVSVSCIPDAFLVTPFGELLFANIRYESQQLVESWRDRESEQENLERRESQFTRNVLKFEFRFSLPSLVVLSLPGHFVSLALSF